MLLPKLDRPIDLAPLVRAPLAEDARGIKRSFFDRHVHAPQFTKLRS
jgi:hypothetical protein